MFFCELCTRITTKMTSIMNERPALQLVRNATLKINYAGHTILVDPVLAEKGTLQSALGVNKNPRVHLVMTPEEVAEGVDVVMLTHNHPDHYDPSVRGVVPAGVTFVVQPEDREAVEAEGFTAVEAVDGTLLLGGMSVTRVPGRHGRGPLADMMGPVSGFVLSAEGLPVVYLMGDCCWDDTTREAIGRYKPDCVVVNSGGAVFPEYSKDYGQIIPNEHDVVEMMAECGGVGKFVAVHMDAIDHCQTTRAILHNELLHAGADMSRIAIPADGETIRL